MDHVLRSAVLGTLPDYITTQTAALHRESAIPLMNYSLTKDGVVWQSGFVN